MEQHVKIILSDKTGSALLLPTDLAGRAVLRKALSESGHDGEVVAFYRTWWNEPLGLRDLIVFRLGEYDEHAPGKFSATGEHLDVCFGGAERETYTLEVVPTDIRYQDFCTSPGECVWQAILETEETDWFLFHELRTRGLLEQLGSPERKNAFLDDLVDVFGRTIVGGLLDDFLWFKAEKAAIEVSRMCLDE